MGYSGQQQFDADMTCIGMTAWCTADGCGWFRVYPDGSSRTIVDSRREWDDHDRAEHTSVLSGGRGE